MRGCGSGFAAANTTTTWSTFATTMRSPCPPPGARRARRERRGRISAIAHALPAVVVLEQDPSPTASFSVSAAEAMVSRRSEPSARRPAFDFLRRPRSDASTIVRRRRGARARRRPCRSGRSPAPPPWTMPRRCAASSRGAVRAGIVALVAHRVPPPPRRGTAARARPLAESSADRTSARLSARRRRARPPRCRPRRGNPSRRGRSASPLRPCAHCTKRR